MLPLQAGGTGFGEKPGLAFSVDYLPLLSGVVEFDVGGTVDFEPAKFVEWDSLGPKTEGCTVWAEGDNVLRINHRLTDDLSHRSSPYAELGIRGIFCSPG